MNKVILATIIPLIFTIGFIPVFAMHQGGSHHEERTDIPSFMGEHHMPHKGICAPGFTALDKICVLDDRCGPGAYPGKVCMMDGIMKQYLRPHHQKHAGISVDNIICAEGKQLMFKSHNASPACVHSHSVDKLKHRGWQAEKPSIECHLEENPVCGMDGITYGNHCMLNSQHMAIRYEGECMESLTVYHFEDCSLPPDGGICEAVIQKFYFDKTTNSCQDFIWGGCGGVVPFHTLEDCRKKCEP